jgi:hypothetical protein
MFDKLSGLEKKLNEMRLKQNFIVKKYEGHFSGKLFII